jgi:hypothetical protein
MDGVEDIWNGRKTTEQTADPTAVGLARAIQPDQWVACVVVDGFEPEESRRRALAATRAALDVMRLVVPAPENAKIRAAVDHAPPFAVDRLSQLDGRDLMRGIGFNWPTLHGRPEDSQSLLNSAVDLRRAAGARIALYLRPEPTAPTGCPRLSDRWVNALHWYGLGCSADADFNAIVNFVIALDVLSGGKEEAGIRGLAARLFRIAEDDPILSDGTKLKKLVERLYGYRSEIAHGSVLGLDERLRDDRGWAERLAAYMLIAYVLELGKYAAAGKVDDRDAFFAALPQPPASAPAVAPAGGS